MAVTSCGSQSALRKASFWNCGKIYRTQHLPFREAQAGGIAHTHVAV